MVGINANIPLVAENAIDTVFVELIAIGGFDMVCVADIVKYAVIVLALISVCFLVCFFSHVKCIDCKSM